MQEILLTHPVKVKGGPCCRISQPDQEYGCHRYNSFSELRWGEVLAGEGICQPGQGGALSEHGIPEERERQRRLPSAGSASW
jgi:hypothetical protein